MSAILEFEQRALTGRYELGGGYAYHYRQVCSADLVHQGDPFLYRLAQDPFAKEREFITTRLPEADRAEALTKLEEKIERDALAKLGELHRRQEALFCSGVTGLELPDGRVVPISYTLDAQAETETIRHIGRVPGGPGTVAAVAREINTLSTQPEGASKALARFHQG